MRAGAYLAYTDGAFRPHGGGRGGWGAAISIEDDSEPCTWDLWGHLSTTSSNRAEALALLAVVAWLPFGSSADVYADSKYVQHMLMSGARSIANADIWTEIRRVMKSKQLEVHVHWVRGHTGHPGNERADALSVIGTVNGRIDKWAQRRLKAGKRLFRFAA
jgi:ribonuclease HI